MDVPFGHAYLQPFVQQFLQVVDLEGLRPARVLIRAGVAEMMVAFVKKTT
jgi:hypothetical protein